MGKCDLFLFPSLHEGLSLAVIEASAAGVPVVGSKIPGFDEAVVDGQTGVLHPVDDLEGMSDSVVTLLTDKAHAHKLSDAGRMRANEIFSVSASAERLLNLYHECLGVS
jgi:glycosyltransferase involved in cell wall biosynthesis